MAQVKELPPGSFVGYGATYRTSGCERIAVIPVGYADGFRRAPHHWGEVLVRGQRAPITGRVCMDQTMINVTHIPGVRQGDEVVLIGCQGDDRITAEEVAAAARHDQLRGGVGDPGARAARNPGVAGHVYGREDSPP